LTYLDRLWSQESEKGGVRAGMTEEEREREGGKKKKKILKISTSEIYLSY